MGWRGGVGHRLDADATIDSEQLGPPAIEIVVIPPDGGCPGDSRGAPTRFITRDILLSFGIPNIRTLSGLTPA